jgi:hypothetical protein
MRKICLFLIITVILNSCDKDKELLRGDIVGKISVTNQDVTASSDNSGVEVSLYNNNTLLNTTLSDKDGLYRFENLPYGKYRIDLQKENYLKDENYVSGTYYYSFNHVGGYSPTIKDFRIYQIPDYVLTIDSVRALSNYGELLVYLKINGDTIIPFPYYSLIGYYGSSEIVSKDNFSGMVTGLVGNWISTSSYKAPAVIYDIYFNLSGTIFMKFYLLTQGQNIYIPINRGALGKPSNVISFTWQ